MTASWSSGRTWAIFWFSRVGWTRLVRSTTRSEEHTSELQSQSNIVCRLLLEKKKCLAGVLKNHCVDRSIIVGEQGHVISSQTASVHFNGAIQKRRGSRLYFPHH